MPLVQSFDGLNRRIYLDPSVINSSWKPLDIFKEYLTYRRDNHQFRGFEPLLRMRGGEPKGLGNAAPRFLQMQTDRRGIITKIILPNLGPYRTKVDGEIATDMPDQDSEPFDVSNLTTPVIIDYKPVEAEIITIGISEQLNLIQSIKDILEGDVIPEAARFRILHKITKTILIDKTATEVGGLTQLTE